MPADVRHFVWEHWRDGLGVRSTQVALARTHGIELDCETIWRAFVEFSWEVA